MTASRPQSASSSAEAAPPAATDLLARADSLLGAARHRLAVVLTGNSGTWPHARGELRLALVELDAARTRLTRLADAIVEADGDPGKEATCASDSKDADIRRVCEFLCQELGRGCRHNLRSLLAARAELSMGVPRIKAAVHEAIRDGRLVSVPRPEPENFDSRQHYLRPAPHGAERKSNAERRAIRPVMESKR
jgi:hypothetical protein